MENFTGPKTPARIWSGTECIFIGDSTLELLMKGLSREGTSFLASLHGCFAAAIWDVQRMRLPWSATALACGRSTGPRWTAAWYSHPRSRRC